RRIEWQTADKRRLAGSLLLPATYQAGQRLPLVVWAYPNKMGSQYINVFGFSASPSTNLQMLATRGYAVFFPDTPMRIGRAVEDIVAAVTSGVDAVIAQGYADPDRLAIMGHSFGSYSTLSVITHSNAYKAAIISAVIHPDLIAFYLKMNA